MVLCPYRCTDGGEIWHVGGDLSNFGPLLHAKFHHHRCKVLPLWGKNLKISL